MLKHTGELPIIGVNTFRNPHGDEHLAKVELMRSTDEEKQSQLKRLADFHATHDAESPAMLKTLQQAVIDNRNVFEVLMEAVRMCALRQITGALVEVGGAVSRERVTHVLEAGRTKDSWSGSALIRCLLSTPEQKIGAAYWVPET